MNIGAAARASGLSQKTIRYYEAIGLLPKPLRTEGGYRDYGPKEVQTLGFLKRARGLGFSVEECRQLVSLYQDRSRSSRDVKALALHRVAEIDAKLAELAEMRATLVHLAANCRGDQRPDCPIIAELALGVSRP